MRASILLGALLMGCATQATEPAGPRYSYYADVKPIMDAKCAGCHHANTIAPFALTTYDEAFAERAAIAAAVRDRHMPPWSASRDCRQYQNDRSLTHAEIRVITGWVAQGAPAGEAPASLAPYKPPVSGLERIDLTLSTPVYDVKPPKDAGVDDHRCFIVDIPLDDDVYVTGVEVVPGNAKLVHHVSLELVEPAVLPDFEALDAADPGPGWYCYGGTGAQPSGYLGGWVPGWTANKAPEGYGRKVSPGTKLVFNMHYNTLYTPAGTDQTQVNLQYSGYKMPLRAAAILDPGWVLQDWFQIKAGDPDAEFTFEYDPTIFTFGRRFLIYNAYIHMHQLGKSGRLTLKREDGREECLLDIEDFDFHWQSEYWFTEPVQVEKGDKFFLECRFDNSAENQPVIDGVRREPQDVGWGGDAPNEMCAGLFLSSF